MRFGGARARLGVALLGIGLAQGGVLAGPSKTARVDFEPVAPGTAYGSPAHLPGQMVLTQNGIDMSVDFFVGRSFSEFNQAEVGGRYAAAFPTRSLELDNISVVFDFSNLDFLVRELSVNYIDFTDAAGASNFSVNGQTFYLLNPDAKLPDLVAPGVTATVDQTTLTLTAGPQGIDHLRIGGQELVIDNVVAVPEPACIVLLLVGAIALFGRARRVWS